MNETPLRTLTLGLIPNGWQSLAFEPFRDGIEIHRLYGEIVQDSRDVGINGVDWQYIHSGAGYVEITGIGVGPYPVPQVTVTVHRECPIDTEAGYAGLGIDSYPDSTLVWAWGAWDAVSGYPRTVTFYEDRLWWGEVEARVGHDQAIDASFEEGLDCRWRSDPAPRRTRASAARRRPPSRPPARGGSHRRSRAPPARSEPTPPPF